MEFSKNYYRYAFNSQPAFCQRNQDDIRDALREERQEFNKKGGKQKDKGLLYLEPDKINFISFPIELKVLLTKTYYIR